MSYRVGYVDLFWCGLWLLAFDTRLAGGLIAVYALLNGVFAIFAKPSGATE